MRAGAGVADPALQREQQGLCGLGAGHVAVVGPGRAASLQARSDRRQHQGQPAFVIQRETRLARGAVQHQGSDQGMVAAPHHRFQSGVKALRAPDFVVQRRVKKRRVVQFVGAAHARGLAMQAVKAWHDLGLAAVVKLVEIELCNAGVDRPFDEVAHQAPVFVGPVKQVAVAGHHLVQGFQHGGDQHFGVQVQAAECAQGGNGTGRFHRHVQCGGCPLLFHPLLG